MLEKAVSNLAHLDELYQDGDTKRKRTIIGSIYPEKLTFDGFQYRTTRVNEAVELPAFADPLRIGFTQNPRSSFVGNEHGRGYELMRIHDP